MKSIKIFLLKERFQIEFILSAKGMPVFFIMSTELKKLLFYTKIQFICAGESYTFNIPAIENYQAVEQTEIYEFTKSKIKSLLIKAPKIDKLYGLRQKMNLLLVKKLLLLYLQIS